MIRARNMSLAAGIGLALLCAGTQAAAPHAALDRAAMQAALDQLLGEHDFASFCRAAEGRTTVRRIEEAAVVAVPAAGVAAVDELHVALRGTAFCHQQVRSIVGSLVEVGRGRRTVTWMGEALAARDRAAAGPVAPPHGLTLEAVGYPDPWPDAPLRSGGAA